MSPQEQCLYHILLRSNTPLSTKELAHKMQIVPSAIYRLTKPLIKMGLIIRTERYPSVFIAKPLDEGLSLFIMGQSDWFTKQFSQTVSKKSDQIAFSFVQSRDELMNRSVEETNKTVKSIYLLRSGHEIPADLMLALVEAKKRGVTIRMLIQDYSPDNASQVTTWIRNGVNVRKTDLQHLRLMIYDATVVYFMSYKHTDSEKDMGMKITYPPFATILSQMFNEWWEKAD